MKKYEYVIFSPYFGKLPVNFELWLKSCSYNNKFKFIVFTNDETYKNIPDNVEMVYLSFEQFKEKIQNRFDFKISLEQPYKLCDYKPTYGYVFKEYLADVKYWGYCDIDLVFGDLEKYLPKDEYDKISFLGHFCMYKNDKNITEQFMFKSEDKIDYRDILSNEQHFGFDEIGDYGINNIFKNKGLKIYNYEVNVADIDCRKLPLNVIKFENGEFKKIEGKRVFEINNGQVIAHTIKGENIEQQEYAYIHFQKRKMTVNIDTNELNRYIISYNGFLRHEPIIKEFIENNQPKKEIIDKRRITFLINAVKRRTKRCININKILKQKRSKI